MIVHNAAPRAVAAAGLAVVLLWSGVATAGGLYLPTRGVRPTARGGAFVAGADDLNSMWFNPAGLVNMVGGASGSDRRHALLDLGFVSQDVTYERIDSGFNPQDPVENEASGITIPTVGVAYDLSDKLVVAGGVYAPYAALGRYAEDGPQRYSLVDLSSSALAIVQLSLAYQPRPRLRVGIGLQNMVSSLVTRQVVNACPGQTVCAPEDPEFDSLAQIEQLDLFSPAGVVGAQYDLTPKVRLGASFQMPFRVSGSGEVAVRLPTNGFFAEAEVVGDEATIDLTLPPIVRLGVEADLGSRVKVEVGGSVEFWSVHETLSATPVDVRIENTPGAGVFEVGSLDVPREFRNTVAVNAGLEAQPLESVPLTVAVGYAFETAASPDEYLSVVTVDGNKQLISGGLGYRFGKVSLYAAASTVMVADRTVSPDDGVAPQLTPIREDPEVGQATPTFINWGSYQSSWFMFGGGVSADF